MTHARCVRGGAVAALVLLAQAVCASRLASQDAVDTDSVGSNSVMPDSAPAPAGAQFLRPLGSLFVPGLGQYLDGAPLAGLGFTSVAITGAAIGWTEDVGGASLPRNGRDQLAHQGRHVLATAAALSTYDAFRRSLPALRRGGKYRFLTAQEDVGDLVSAPFDIEFLSRWTTWVNFAFAAVVSSVVLGEREDEVCCQPYHGRDALFAASLSLNAGVGEEGLFRGWLFPLLHQNLGESFWASNGLQAGMFAGLHVPQADAFALGIGAWALYQGWIVRRNGWSIRESVFHHFWYDAAVVTASLLADEQATIRIVVPAHF